VGFMHTKTNSIKGKRDNGEGSIRFITKRDLWEVRLSYGTKGNGKPDRRSDYAQTLPEAKKLLKRMIKERDAIINTNSQSILMRDYYYMWLDNKREKIKENSCIRIRQIVETHILPEIGYVKLGNVSYNDCKKIMDKIAEKELSFSTRKKVYEALNACFRWALEKRDILFSPMLGMEKPTLNTDNIPSPKEMLPLKTREYALFSEEAIRCYKNGVSVYRLGWLFIFMLATGIRIGEALALKWTDIDFNLKEVHIWQTTVLTELKSNTEKRKYGAKVASRTKTHAGNRKITLNFTALQALAELEKVTGKFEHIASTKTGVLISHRNILRTFHGILRALKLPTRGLHNLRHTFASQLFEKKVDIKIISALLGHSSVQITMDTYIHFIEEQTRKAIYALDYLANNPEDIQPILSTTTITEQHLPSSSPIFPPPTPM